MTKNDVADIVSISTQSTKTDVMKIINCFIETIKEKALLGEQIEIRGFGTFYLNTKERREIFSPISQKKIDVPATSTVLFKPSKALRITKGD
ncbi:MAG: HU family DNA-binding protein [Spirochaetes bacterium]|nr:HU family DNA-binding protein [Spirochaetota bacterium]